MSRYQHKNTTKNSQNGMSPLVSTNPTTVGLEKCNVAEVPDKDFKIAILNIIKNLKKGMNKSTSKIIFKKSAMTYMKKVI